jgi:hypothetical protein
LLALLFSALAFSASADRLVLRDGTIIPTRGPFQIKGRVVIFTQPNGTLSSLRVDELDLDASRPPSRGETPPLADIPAPPGQEASLSAPSPEDESLPVPKNLTPLGREQLSPAPPPLLPDAEPRAGTRQGEAEHLLVRSWESTVDQGLEIRGRLVNASSNLATGIVMRVTVLGPDDRVLEEKKATLNRTRLSPYDELAFSVSFPELTGFAFVHFAVESQRLEFSPTAGGDAR